MRRADGRGRRPRAAGTPRRAALLAVLLAGAALHAGFIAPPPAAAFDDIVDVIAPERLALVVVSDTLSVPYYSNRALETTHPEVTRAVVIVHGTLRNADDYFQTLVDAAAGGDSTTLLVAPQFLTEDDLIFHAPTDSLLYWEYMGWRQGDQSLSTPGHPRPWQLSAYAVADTLLARIAARNPNLEQLVLCGHSAGGQFANRYAAGSPMPDTLAAAFGVPLRCVVANPSTYLYLTADRWRPGTTFAFGLPDAGSIAACPEYDTYKYGLENPNPYMDRGAEQIRAQYVQRDVVYLLGTYDNDPNSFYLDRSCPAMLEGVHRLQRGIVYFEFLKNLYGPALLEHQRLALVAGVTHSHHAMFTSDCGVFYLFDTGSCESEGPSIPWMEVTQPALASVGGHGAAWNDYDTDGDLDLYVTGSSDSNVLARNEGDGRFSDATPPELADAGQGMTAAWGDFDGDGDRDLYLANWNSPNRLYRNDGGGGFRDVTPPGMETPGHLCDLGWSDFDLDGDLDLYVTRTQGEANSLWRNDGAEGFTDLGDGPTHTRAGPARGTAAGLPPGGDDSRGTAWGDFDGDGDPDLYLAVDGPNRLLRNDGGGAFTDVADELTGYDGDSSAGLWGDADQDGDLDLLLANRGAPNRLFRNDGGGGFSDATAGPLADPAVTWSAAWADVDLDGDQDLYLAASGTPDRLLRNDGDLSFADATAFLLGNPTASRCAAWADFDADGDLDLYLATNGSANRLFAQSGVPAAHWLQIELAGASVNRFAVGARLRAVLLGGARLREVGHQAGYLAQSSLAVELGLGAATVVDTLRIAWPGGPVQELLAVAADQRLLIGEPGTAPIESPAPGGAPLAFRLHQNRPNPFNPGTLIRFELPVAVPVRLRIFDAGGRQVRRLVEARQLGAGEHAARWDGRTDAGVPAASGVYFYRLEAGGRRTSRRMLLVR